MYLKFDWTRLKAERLNSMSTLSAFVTTLSQSLRLILTDPAHFWALVSLVIIGDAFLTELIIRFVSCKWMCVRLVSIDEQQLPDTEIDWETYMVQVELYLKGQHNYSQITGPTGPVVWVVVRMRFSNSEVIQVSSWAHTYPQLATRDHYFRKRHSFGTAYLWRTLHTLPCPYICDLYASGGCT